MKSGVFFTGLVLGVLLATAARGQENSMGCFAPGLTSAAKIDACTKSLDGGALPPETRALALLARAEALAETGAAAKALADYDAAFVLISPDAAALLARGKLHDAA
jgi:hypothetical protein